jgi:hypothetical protein
MTTPLKVFFEKSPLSKDLFDALVVSVITRFPETSIRIEETQIALVSRHPYAAIWIPSKAVQDQPNSKLILSLGLDKELKDPRIIQTDHPYPNRWMIHLIIENKEDIDETLLHYLDLAHTFSITKTKTSKAKA